MKKSANSSWECTFFVSITYLVKIYMDFQDLNNFSIEYLVVHPFKLF